MIAVYIKAFFMIFVAEMGDKTQILAMTFALKYPMGKILLGVAIGAFLNHGLAIGLGTMLTKVVPISALQIFAGTLFVFFAFFSLKIDDDDVEDNKTKYGAILTVAIAFFIGELGDKTQLTALGLGTSESYPFLVLLGTTTGMVLTSLMGIVIGAKLGKRMPEDKLKMMSFLIFSFFGIEKIYTYIVLPMQIHFYFYFLIIIYLMISIYVIRKFIVKFKAVQSTAYTRKAERLYELKNHINEATLNLCQSCDVCDGKACLIGYLKLILESEDRMMKTDELVISSMLNKSFDADETKNLLKSLSEYYLKYPDEFELNEFLIHVRRILINIVDSEMKEVETLEEFIKKYSK
ncbi:MAG: TMEM165/GDT1 family protein [Clostridiales bacterium]|nr:TMEM165/GDT1 family protein [Clostridiales bacterium]